MHLARTFLDCQQRAEDLVARLAPLGNQRAVGNFLTHQPVVQLPRHDLQGRAHSPRGWGSSRGWHHASASRALVWKFRLAPGGQGAAPASLRACLQHTRAAVHADPCIKLRQKRTLRLYMRSKMKRFFSQWMRVICGRSSAAGRLVANRTMHAAARSRCRPAIASERPSRCVTDAEQGQAGFPLREARGSGSPSRSSRCAACLRCPHSLHPSSAAQSPRPPPQLAPSRPGAACPSGCSTQRARRRRAQGRRQHWRAGSCRCRGQRRALWRCHIAQQRLKPARRGAAAR